MTAPEDVQFDGDKLTIRADTPFKMVVTIDNEDRVEYPDNPFTLNASVNDVDLSFWGEDCLIEGDVPAQLRALAELIETGGVLR
ncbi:hypothetical protein ACFVAJ_19150 [Agromyces sp. NPDC057679]|uniref:hypothetical protein n=1 Tax=Agromyces sp. NPDC057679 TaxID=3346207 RepID=UPI00366E46D8